MSRGNYRGGSTIVGRSGWSSYDPAELSDSDIIKIENTTTKKRKQQKKQKQAKSLRGISRTQLINLILDNHLKGLENFRLPKSTSQSLRDEISRNKSPFEWAEKQPPFKKIKEKKLAKESRKKNGAETIASTENIQTQKDRKIAQKKNKPDYEERVAEVKDKLNRRIKNVEILKSNIPRKSEVIKRSIIAKQTKNPEHELEVESSPTISEPTELKGYLLSWFKYKHFLTNKQITKKGRNELTRRRKLLRDRIFELLPSPPEPKTLGDEANDLKRLRDAIIISWEKDLNERLLSYWNFLTAQERHSYLLHQTAFAAFLKRAEKANLRQIKQEAKTKRSKKKSIGVSDLTTSDALKVIKKRLAERNTETWDYKKTDWDLT